MLFKMFLTAAAVAWGASHASAQSLANTYTSICDSLHVTGLEVPSPDSTEHVKSMSMAALPAQEVTKARSLLAALPPKSLWLEVEEIDSQVYIYGEEADQDCCLLMLVSSHDEDNMLLFIRGDHNVLNEIKL